MEYSIDLDEIWAIASSNSPSSSSSWKDARSSSYCSSSGFATAETSPTPSPTPSPEVEEVADSSSNAVDRSVFVQTLPSLDTIESTAADFATNCQPFADGFEWNNCVPRMYSKDIVQPTTEDIAAYTSMFLMTKGPYVIQRDCIFNLMLENGKPAVEVDLESLNMTVVSPTGLSYPVFERTLFEDRITCTFRPLEIGKYTINVFIRDYIEMRGSPVTCCVSRDYFKKLPRPIVSFGLDPVTYTKFPSKNADPKPFQKNRRPWGICCNTKTEQLLIADRKVHEILIYQPEGDLLKSFGGFGDFPGQFNRPTSVVFDAVGDRILVCDKDNHRIQIFTPDGEFLFTFGEQGTRSGQFLYPWNLAVSPDGSLIAVADSRNHRIQLFTINGKYLRQFRPLNSQSKDTFDYPRGICFDQSGNHLYITDFNLHCVFKLHISLKSCVVVVPPGVLKRPSGIAIDSVGNFLVCDSRHHCLKVFKAQGKQLVSLRSIGRDPIQLPMDIAVMKAGFLALIDSDGHVRIF